MKLKGTAAKKKKSLNRKCVGYGDGSGTYGLCKTRAWASAFPERLSWSLSGRWGNKQFLSLMKIFTSTFPPSSRRLAKVIP